MVVNWTNPAIKDLKDFREYTRIINVSEYILKLVETTNFLIEQPKLGKIYLYTNGYIIRQLIHEKHIILYYIDDDTINIIAVIHHKQDTKRRIDYIKNFLQNNQSK